MILFNRRKLWQEHPSSSENQKYYIWFLRLGYIMTLKDLIWIHNYKHIRFYHMKYSDVEVVRRFRFPLKKKFDLVRVMQVIILFFIYYDFGFSGLLATVIVLLTVFWNQIYCYKFEFRDGSGVFIEDTMVMRLIRDYLTRREVKQK